MKKIVLSLLFMLFMITINAQNFLYKGITSGMTATQFDNYIDTYTEFVWSDNKDFVTNYVKDKLYVIYPSYNKGGKLRSLLFYGTDGYDSTKYDPNVKNIALELFSLLTISYGEPTYDKWINWTDISEESSDIVTMFKKESVVVVMLVAEEKDLYYVGLIINDTKYNDKEITSEGF